MHRLLSAANRLSGINKSNSSTHSYVFVFLFLAIGLFISIFAFPQTSYANTITVSGLVSNNSTISVTQNNTRLIQAALDKASSEGGGKVIIPAGKYYLDRRGTNLEDCQYNNGRYCLIARDNVLLTGSTTRASDTVLCPIIRENIPGDPNHDQDKKWGLDCFFFDGIRKFNGETRELVDNADFQNFTVDGRYAAIADGADYHASGKGFFFKGFKNCDWENVQVLNTDGTGFGVDFPINCTIKNCYAEKCGKACLLSGSGLGGASGFGIGVGWKDNESMIIENCTSVENANFGFFFEHQCRFDPLVTAKTSNKFQVKNSVAYGNLHNFGGNRTMDTYYYNCTSKIDPDSEFEERTHDAFLFDNYSVRSNFVNCSLQQSPTDISSLTSSQKTALNWAMKEGIVSMGGLGNYDVFRPNDQVYPMEYMTLLYRAFDLGQENVLFVLEPWQGGNVRNTVEAETGPIPSDVDLDAYYGPAYRWAKLAGCDLDNCKVDVFWNGNGQKIASWLQTLLKNTKYKSYFKSTNPTQISQYNSNSLPTTRIGIIEAMYAMIKNMTPAAPTLKTTPVPNSEDTGTITVTSSYVNSPLGTPDNISSMPFTLGFYLNGTSLEYQCSYTPGSSLTTPNLPKGTYTVRAISTAGCGYSLASSSVRILSEGSNASCSLRLTVLSGTVNFNAKCNGSGVGAGTYTIQRSSNSEYVGQINFPASGTIAESMYPDNYKLVPTSVSLPYIDTNTYPFTVSNGTITNVNVVVTTPLDLTRFQAAVSQAEQLLSSVVVSDTGNGLSQGQQYVSSSDEQDLRDAIEIAREAVGKATGQAQVESATTALNNAISTFRTRIQIASGPLDLTQFNDALIRANSLLSTTVSVDGTDLPAGQQYATQSMIDDLNAAINMARTASSSFADQDAVDNATEALSSAIIRFTSDLRTSTGPVSMGSLSDAMDTAQSLLDTTPVSSDGKDLTICDSTNSE